MHRERNGWRVRWRVNGKRFSRVYSDRKEAEREEHKIKAGVFPEAAAPSLTFAAFADVYLARHCRLHKAESQWIQDENALKNHLLPSFGELELTSLTKGHLEQLKVELAAKSVRGGAGPRKLAPKTINNVLGLAKKVLAVAVDLEHLGSNPWARVRPVRRAEMAFDYWTPAERDLFLERARRLNPAFTELVLVACHTGLRLGELGALRRDDLDFENGIIRVDETYDALRKRIQASTKNRTVGWVRMNDPVRAVLRTRTLAGPKDFVFARPLLLHAGRTLRALAKRVGVKPIRFHDLRHTFASCLAMAGVDLLVIQQLCRHKTYTMTLRYSHLHPSHLKGATDVLARAWPAALPESQIAK